VKLRVALAAGGALLGAALLLVFYPSTNSGEGRADAGRLMTDLMSGKAAVGGPFALPDASGHTRPLSDFRGKLVLLYFGYTQCPDVCPTDLARIGAMLRSLGPQAEAVQPLFVTLDPERDTSEILREYAAAFHPRLIALRGSEEETRRIATSYKLFYEKVAQPRGYVIDHAPLTFLLDREGKYIAFFPPGTPADRMAVMVREALQQPG
jgi:protein SCO1/2